MLKHLSRKRLDLRTTGSFTDVLTRQSDATASGQASRAVGCVAPVAEGAPKSAFFSAASHFAKDPATDAHVLRADSNHLFAAVLTSKTTARGGHYLRQHIHSELLAQIKQHGGDVPKALEAAVSHLNRTFRNLHPTNPAVLEGVQATVAHLDFATNKLHVASTGGCRCVVGKALPMGGIEVVADVGRPQSSTAAPTTIFTASDVFGLQLEQRADTIILGSAGLWQELSAHNSLLRTEHFYTSAPKANQGSAALHLTNFALHAVTRRLRGSNDLRMQSLRSVSNLLSLHSGERSQFKWGDRQPVRRRRGDVHGDLTAVIFRLDWEGKQCSFKEQPKKIRPTLASRQQQIPPRQYSHWDLVRLHFLDFPRESRRHSKSMWQDTVQQAVSRHQDLRKAAPEAAPIGKSGVPLGKIALSASSRLGLETQPLTPVKEWA